MLSRQRLIATTAIAAMSRIVGVEQKKERPDLGEVNLRVTCAWITMRHSSIPIFKMTSRPGPLKPGRLIYELWSAINFRIPPMLRVLRRAVIRVIGGPFPARSNLNNVSREMPKISQVSASLTCIQSGASLIRRSRSRPLL